MSESVREAAQGLMDNEECTCDDPSSECLYCHYWGKLRAALESDEQEPVAWTPAFTPPEKDGWYWGISSTGAEGKCCFEDDEWHHMADRNYCQFYRPLNTSPQPTSGKCECTADETTGHTTVKCCNICGLPLEEESWSFNPLPPTRKLTEEDVLDLWVDFEVPSTDLDDLDNFTRTVRAIEAKLNETNEGEKKWK